MDQERKKGGKKKKPSQTNGREESMSSILVRRLSETKHKPWRFCLARIEIFFQYFKSIVELAQKGISNMNHPAGVCRAPFLLPSLSSVLRLFTWKEKRDGDGDSDADAGLDELRSFHTMTLG